MRRYETMVLLSSELSEEAVEERISLFEKQVKEGEGSVLNLDRWGKKRLAYPIKRQRHGYYFIVTFECNAPTLQEIERNLRIHEDTWRFMTVRLDPGLLRKLEKNEKQAARRALEGEGRDDDGNGRARRERAVTADES
ncbi:MAG: 30S ribosomal protein S6 [bacterium]|nr:30S ribosomal protein S6 [bacterium]